MFIGGVFHDSQLDGGEPIGPTPSYFTQTWGYLVILAMLLIERICINWLQDKFGCTPACFKDIERLD